MDPNAMAAVMSRMGVTPQQLQNMERQPFNHSSGPRRPPAFETDLSEHELERRFEEYEAWTEYDRSLDPVKVPFDSPASLMRDFGYVHQFATDQFHSPETLVRQSITGFAKHSSSTPLEQLKIISLSEMLVRKVHKGRFLLCRSITPCTRLVSVQMLVEDPDGQVRDLSIYNFPSVGMGSSPEDVAAVFPVGTVLAIREPTLKMPTQGYRPIIRVDSPSDIVFKGPHSDLARGTSWKTGSHVNGSLHTPTSANAWKARGDTHFKAGRWLAAMFSYSSGIALDPTAYILRLNRAEVFLRLEYYSAAQADAEHVLGLPLDESFRQKALWRAGKAYYGRGDYTGSAKLFAQWLRSQPGDRDTIAWIDRCWLRFHESATGDYDWTRLFNEAQISPHVEAGDYLGSIHVSEMIDRGGGRGIVATRDISPGDLLVAAKPFASAFDVDFPPSEKEVLISFDTIRKSVSTRTQAAVLSRAIQKLYGNPDMYNSVFDLYGGPAYETPSSYSPAIETDPQFPESFPFHPAVDIDITRLESICSHNLFAPKCTNIFDPSAPQKGPADNATGLYLLPSLFNHACHANSTWFCVGDFMVIRAKATIRAGEEITLSYTSGLDTYRKREDAMKTWMVAGCDCSLCDDDRRDGASTRKRRERLISQFLKQHTTAPLARLRTLVKDIASAYSPDRGALRPDMWQVYHLFGESLRLRLNENPAYLEESIEAEFSALESVGVRVVDRTIRGVVAPPKESPIASGEGSFASIISSDNYILTLVTIAHAFLIMDDPERTSRWMKTAIAVHGLTFGGDKSYFLVRFGTFLGDIGLLNAAEAVKIHED
ncbi:hypothetical protein PLICRDRAFT_33842 [Plicaturopsis crispa FD-325 SS-3]|nr:hypothetical protein PLICRDRAFT_33842 [Plicaturopsis crispa FD-325 SS-3]